MNIFVGNSRLQSTIKSKRDTQDGVATTQTWGFLIEGEQQICVAGDTISPFPPLAMSLSMPRHRLSFHGDR
jgi:hypothetical protein